MSRIDRLFKRQMGDDVNELELELRGKLDAKTQEIESFMAKLLGLGDIDDLDSHTRERHEANVRNMIEKHEEGVRHLNERHQEAMVEGDVSNLTTGRESIDRSPTRIGRLLEQRQELVEQILQLQGLGGS